MNERDYGFLGMSGMAEPRYASKYLSDRLRSRELFLLLGAGISLSAGLPDWSTLVADCARSAGVDPPVSTSAGDLMAAMDSVRIRLVQNSSSTGEYYALIRRCLYGEARITAGHYGDFLLENRLLIALGALIMASSRGSVTDVFNMNFDDLLEWYLHLHGTRTAVVAEFPRLIPGNADVTVFHPHGFLPLVDPDRASEFVVFSQSEFLSRGSMGPAAPWQALLAARLMSKCFLAVGTSLNDMDLQLALSHCSSQVRTSERPLGFLVDKDIDESRRQRLAGLGVVGVSVSDYSEVSNFLLEICRTSAMALV